MECGASGTVPKINKLRLTIAVTEDSRDAQVKHFALIILEKLEELRMQSSGITERAKAPVVEDPEADVDEVRVG